MEKNKIEQTYQMIALARRVLIVAVITQEKETKRMIAWETYLDAVPGENYSLEFMEVIKHGEKQDFQIAHQLFPRLDIKKYR